MVYLIYGNQAPTIKSRINKITKTFLEDLGIDEFSFVKLDGNNVLIQDAIDECRYVSLGYDKKVVSVENCYFLLKPKPKNKIDVDQDFDVLKKYLKETVDECILILSVPSISIDEKSEIVSLISKNGKVEKIDDPTEKDFIEYIKLYCKKYNIVIDNAAINELASRTDGDVALFKNSISKLALYTDHIRYDDVVKMVVRKLEDEAYLISNYLIEGNNIQAVALFRDLRVKNVEPVTLIGQISNQFRLINEVRYLLRIKRLSQEEASKELKIKPGRVFALSRLLSLVSEQAINNAIEDLYQLDYEIKSGQVDRFYAFEMFLLKFKRN